MSETVKDDSWKNGRAMCNKHKNGLSKPKNMQHQIDKVFDMSEQGSMQHDIARVGR